MDVPAFRMFAKWGRAHHLYLMKKDQPKFASSTTLAEAVLAAATAALSERDEARQRDGLASDRREDARAVAVAVLATLGGAKGRPGLHPFRTRQAQELLSLADDLDGGSVINKDDVARPDGLETASLEFAAIFRMQGETAFLDGEPMTKSPWLAGTEEHKAWCDGWIDESERRNQG